MNDHAMSARPEGARRAGEAHLWVCSGKNVGRRYRVAEAHLVMGRAADCDLVVEDERASQRHARIRLVQGAHLVEDLGSTNGTFVNNQRIVRTPLRDGDLLQVGETVFEYLSAEESGTARGTQPGRDGIPDPIRSGAQGALNRVRSAEDSGSAPASLVPPSVPGVLPGYPAYAGHYAATVPPPEPAEAPKKGPDLLAILARIRRVALLYVPYWPTFVAFAFVGLMLGALHFKLKPPASEASFQVMLRPGGTSSDTFGGGSNDNLQFFADQVIERFLSPPLVEASLERLSGKSPGAGAVDGHLARLSFFRLGMFNSNLYEGRFLDGTKEGAVRYLNTHLETFLEREVEIALSQVKADVAFFTDEFGKAARALEAAQQALSDYKANNPDALPELVRSNYTQFESLRQRRLTLEQTAASIEARMRENRRLLQATPRTHAGSFVAGNNFQSQIGTLNAQLAAARAAGKGDEHPEVTRLKRQVAELEALAQDPEMTRSTAQLALNPLYQQLEQRINEDSSSLGALRKEMQQVEKDFEAQQEKLKDYLPKAEAEFQELNRRYETVEAEHKALDRKLRNAQLQLERERKRADVQYQLIVPTRPLTKSTGKARIIRLAAGAIGGLALAFAIATTILFATGRMTLRMIFGRDVSLTALYAMLDDAERKLDTPALPAPESQNLRRLGPGKLPPDDPTEINGGPSR